MRFLAVHPGPLLYTKIFLRLEPLGLELVAAAVRRAGHDVRLLDLQVASHEDYFALVDRWRPDVVAFSCNYLANVPEIVDLAKLTRAMRVDRVRPRLPVGLLVLQRVDLLRPELSDRQPGARGGGPGAGPGARRLHRRRRGIRAGPARIRDRGGGRAARDPQAVLSRDA